MKIFEMQHFSVLIFLLAWPPQTQSFNPEDIALVTRPICDDYYEECIPDDYDTCEDQVDSENGGIEFSFLSWGLFFIFCMNGGTRCLYSSSGNSYIITIALMDFE